MNVVKAAFLAISLVKELEGYSAHRYRDGGDKWTIGYGHLITKEDGDLRVVSKEEAESLLMDDLIEAEAAIDRLVKVDLTQGQKTALISFVFNIGEDQFRSSGTLRVLNQGKYEEAIGRMQMWNKIADPETGVLEISKGLTNRRKKEAEVWRS